MQSRRACADAQINRKSSEIRLILVSLRLLLMYNILTTHNIMQSSINAHALQTLLHTPLSSDHWHLLEPLSKSLHAYLQRCSKNRDYVEAQRAKQKLEEVRIEMKRREVKEIENRMEGALEQLSKKQEDERRKFEKEWEFKCNKINRDFDQLIDKKQDKHLQEESRHLQQLELALPNSPSPDNEIQKLKHEEQIAAKEFDFERAQRFKERIQERERNNMEKHRKLRENNIILMTRELKERQQNQLRAIQNKRRDKLEEAEKQRIKKIKELQAKWDRQMKEIKWIYSEETKRYTK